MNPSLLAATVLLLSTASASAGTNEYSALMKARKYADVERAAAARLAREPANADALVARSSAIAGGGNQARIPEAIGYAEQCVRRHPSHSPCHLALGQMLGWKAMAGGILSAIGYAGDIRGAFQKAVELDPRNLDARFSLLQFYLMAPSIAGGGSSKAVDLAGKTAALSPEGARIMQGMIDLHGGNLAKAEATANAARPGGDEELAERHEGLLVSIAGKFMSEKKLADAERIVQTTARLYPESEQAAFMTARVRQEQGRHREAVVAFEALLAKHARGYIHYRLGQSQQALGEKAKAVAAFEKALAATPGLNPKQKSDAQAQLATLKS
ncbi:tetratricopeptide repeat protein [Massilia sp. PAMC28688]|uniref:tetratricopeptide repeat protein n=1 Tax=Massilia sp. PAMC28688 TaxID=2861283 RepID=UPI001C627026|nr:tetratricopeptide repeat protein [Massilia sp. PAMC28688]QYF92082.1 tetratricopeptide repeat protein [Massilia sp. PAMC28688]